MFKMRLYKLQTIPKILLLLTLLSGCAKANFKIDDTPLILPDMPIAGNMVANELINVCTEEDCKHLTQWLNDLYRFRLQYIIYQHYLSGDKFTSPKLINRVCMPWDDCNE